MIFTGYAVSEHVAGLGHYEGVSSALEHDPTRITSSSVQFCTLRNNRLHRLHTLVAIADGMAIAPPRGCRKTPARVYKSEQYTRLYKREQRARLKVLKMWCCIRRKSHIWRTARTVHSLLR